MTDVRELQRRFKAQGLELQTEADESGKGPASCVLVDPDGNPILFDLETELQIVPGGHADSLG
jgi:hypothetical protein